MKIKTKKQTWRRVGRLLGSDFCVILAALAVFNLAFDLVLVEDFEIEGLNARDLVVVSKIDKEIADGDLILICADGCKIYKLLAKSGDAVWQSDGRVIINGMDSGEDENVVNGFGGGNNMIVARGNRLRLVDEKQAVGKVIMLLRAKNFSMEDL